MPVPNVSILDARAAASCCIGVVLLLSRPLSALPRPRAAPAHPTRNLGFQPLSDPVPARTAAPCSRCTTSTISISSSPSVAHRLIKRLPNEPEDDKDRIRRRRPPRTPHRPRLARTTWRLHDHAQYLWNLGHGHFLLRVRDTLTTFAPLANLSTGEPFAEIPSSPQPIAASPPSFSPPKPTCSSSRPSSERLPSPSRRPHSSGPPRLPTLSWRSQKPCPDQLLSRSTPRDNGYSVKPASPASSKPDA